MGCGSRFIFQEQVRAYPIHFFRMMLLIFFWQHFSGFGGGGIIWLLMMIIGMSILWPSVLETHMMNCLLIFIILKCSCKGVYWPDGLNLLIIWLLVSLNVDRSCSVTHDVSLDSLLRDSQGCQCIFVEICVPCPREDQLLLENMIHRWQCDALHETNNNRPHKTKLSFQNILMTT